MTNLKVDLGNQFHLKQYEKELLGKFFHKSAKFIFDKLKHIAKRNEGRQK